MLYAFKDFQPQFKTNPWQGWIADNATVLGRVFLGDFVSVWFGAVIRGDNDEIHIGNYSNVQENVVIHTDPDLKVTIGDYVTLGHQATIHGCQIGNNTLIGMNAVILNRAQIGNNCIIAANALVPENAIIPDNSLVMGTPGRIVQTLDSMAIARIRKNAEHYAQHFQYFKNLKAL